MAIRLVDLDKPLEPVVLPSGREVPVVPINGAVMQLQEEFQNTKDVKLLWKIVAHLLPDAKPEEITSLSAAMCTAVVGIAMGMATNIMAEIEAEARKRKEAEGNSKAAASRKPKARRPKTGSASQ